MKKKIFLLSILIIFAVVLCASKKHKSDKNTVFLYNRIPSSNKRYFTFALAFKLIQERNAKVIVETGTARNGETNCKGDGCSTILFAEWAKQHGAHVFSVDIDPKATAAAKKAVERIYPGVSLHTMDSIAFLQAFEGTIDFLYLDSYDFYENDPQPSQQHHLNEIMAAYPHLGDHTIVMIDDCGLAHGGKGKLAIDWLQTQGWQVLTSQYQTILVKANTN